MKLSKDFSRFFIIPIVLLFGIVLTIWFCMFYTSTTHMPNGKIISTHWPKEFTLQFSKYLSVDEDIPNVTDSGKKLLDQNALWLQILDESGNEVSQYEKPDAIPKSYQPYQLLHMYQSGSSEYSVFVGSLKVNDMSYTYLIGFPLTISKIAVYVDAQRYNSGKVLILATILVTIGLILALIVFYNIFFTRNMERIRKSLCDVAIRQYKPVSNQSFLGEIYEGIDRLNSDIEAGDQRRKQDEKAKEEWLANITHDLKTPLAPICGYAELLSNADTAISDEQIRRYGEIILKNAQYTEQLVNDLKMTYQLQSNMLPIKKESKNVIRFVKEVIIDLLNTPEYESSKIAFSSDNEALTCEFDPNLLKRALNNIIVNALKHNKKDTDIQIHIECREKVRIVIADNGCGMNREELKDLFTRYYRGTNTETRTEGTGLGMAIAKQIIEAHGGTITAESTPMVGTTIIIQLLL